MNLSEPNSFDELVLLINNLTDEKSKRILLSKAADVYGYGGRAHVLALTGMSYPMVSPSRLRASATVSDGIMLLSVISTPRSSLIFFSLYCTVLE